VKVSTEKTKILACQGKEPMPSKICMYNRMLERVNLLSYIGYTLLYQGEIDISNKTAKYTKTMRV
jgi:hypothetical protein